MAGRSSVPNDERCRAWLPEKKCSDMCEISGEIVRCVGNEERFRWLWNFVQSQLTMIGDRIMQKVGCRAFGGRRQRLTRNAIRKWTTFSSFRVNFDQKWTKISIRSTYQQIRSTPMAAEEKVGRSVINWYWSTYQCDVRLWLRSLQVGVWNSHLGFLFHFFFCILVFHSILGPAGSGFFWRI